MAKAAGREVPPVDQIIEYLTAQLTLLVRRHLTAANGSLHLQLDLLTGNRFTIDLGDLIAAAGEEPYQRLDAEQRQRHHDGSNNDLGAPTAGAIPNTLQHAGLGGKMT